ncbi:hypothetical protein Tco_0583375 [Tanacetum coccineum]
MALSPLSCLLAGGLLGSSLLTRKRSGKEIQREVENFIKNENLTVCAILETYLMEGNLSNVCGKVLGNCTSESIMCLIEDVNSNIRMYRTLIYAKNDGRDRGELWIDLEAYCHITNGEAWCLMGEFSVTMKNNEHTNGMSFSSPDLLEFHDCVSNIEVEDINKIGFHFTWTKSLLNPNTATLKKLDTIIENGKFVYDIP